MFSSGPINELDAAATKLQKVYKSYRTRRNLADCAVVVEELWWKMLDFATLKQNSVTFFNSEEPDTAISRWQRVRIKVAKIGKGLSKDENAQVLAPQYWLEAIDPYHRFGDNLHFYHVDLTSVKRCAIDDDNRSYIVSSEESKTETVADPSTTTISIDIDAANINSSKNDEFDAASHEEGGMDTNAANVEQPVFDLSKRLSCKWTSGVGPRIGCVRDYPMELQTRALEQVNLSPKLTPGYSRCSLPIPSPRPSPKIRMSPRLAYMGLPSPRPSVSDN